MESNKYSASNHAESESMKHAEINYNFSMNRNNYRREQNNTTYCTIVPTIVPNIINILKKKAHVSKIQSNKIPNIINLKYISVDFI